MLRPLAALAATTLACTATTIPNDAPDPARHQPVLCPVAADVTVVVMTPAAPGAHAVDPGAVCAAHDIG